MNNKFLYSVSLLFKDNEYEHDEDFAIFEYQQRLFYNFIILMLIIVIVLFSLFNALIRYKVTESKMYIYFTIIFINSIVFIAYKIGVFQSLTLPEIED